MKKILLFTGFTPTIDNYNGPSAMMYHLLKNRSKEYDLWILSTNWNHVPPSIIKKSSEQLYTTIDILKDDIYNYFHRRAILADIRIKLKIDKYYNQSNWRLTTKWLKKIKKYNPDIIWIYGEDKTAVINQLQEYNLLIAGYDCFPLHWHRLLNDPYCYTNPSYYQTVLCKYKQAISCELALKNIKCTYYDVGITDRNMFEVITGRKDAQFYPHPHFSVLNKRIDFQKDKLSILISGSLNEYTWSDATKILQSLYFHDSLANKFNITFLGKGWDVYYNKLSSKGYSVILKKWVETYAEEVIKHDIQIFPISIGSGTKGKVLDALSMGVLSIGSLIAFENIYVKSGHSCFQYEDANDIHTILESIYIHKAEAEQVARRGKEQVLKWHNPKRIFQIIMNDIEYHNYNGILEYKSVIQAI